MIRCCIFDLDGTLLYTLKTITYYINLVLSRHGIEGITEEQCKFFIGNGARKLIGRALESKGIFDGELGEKILSEFNFEYYNAEYAENNSNMTEPYSGIPELLSKLKDKGMLLGVVSNKPNDTTAIVIAKNFPGVFDLVRGGIEGIPLKPSPDGIIDVMNKLGVSPSEVMYIGDTGVDMKAGKSANAARTVGVLWGYRPKEELLAEGADILVENALDILREVDDVE